MKRTFNSPTMLWLALGCVLLVNGFMLGKVYFNRSEVIATLELTERELRLPYGYGFEKEDSSARVSLQWSTPVRAPVDPGLESWHWYHDRQLQLSEDHFASFNFAACSETYRVERKKPGWVLLEFNGSSYADFVARAEQHHASLQNSQPANDTEAAKKELSEKQKNAAEFLRSAKATQSRLFIVDAAADRQLLERARDKRPLTDGARLLVVPADIQPSYTRCDKDIQLGTAIQVMNLAVESLYIPRELARDFKNESSQSTKFIADIYYGRFYEPWVAGFKPFP